LHLEVQLSPVVKVLGLVSVNQVLNSNPTVDQINTNTTAANDAKTELNNARSNLTPDQAPLQQAKVELQDAINLRAVFL
jgi:hypothetical protein